MSALRLFLIVLGSVPHSCMIALCSVLLFIIGWFGCFVLMRHSTLCSDCMVMCVCLWLCVYIYLCIYVLLIHYVFFYLWKSRFLI